MSLARGAARGAAWNFASVLVERGVGFLILPCCCVLFLPGMVGLIAIASAISDLARVVANSGAGEQVQAKPGDRQRGGGRVLEPAIGLAALHDRVWGVAPWIAGLYACRSSCWCCGSWG